MDIANKFILTLLLLPLLATGRGSRHIAVNFLPVFADSVLVPEGSYRYMHSKVQINTLRFYISAIELRKDGKQVWAEPGSYHLLDLETPGSMSLVLNAPAGIEFDSINFHLGIDSLTNVSGAMSGDLDPTKGMYWSWQSGYINFKLEGVSPLCTARKNEFQFHLGGYAGPQKNLQTITLASRGNDRIDIRFDAAQFLAGIDLGAQHSIMIPGKEANALAMKAASIFTVVP